MSTTTIGSRTGRRYAFAVALLLLLLAGLAGAYYYLTRAPELESTAASGEKDRNFLFSIYGFEGDLLRRPSSVGVDPEGNIHVADTGKKRIVVFDADGNYVTTYGDFGKEALQIWEPIDVAVAPDGRSYVVDRGLKKVVMYDSAHKATQEFVLEGEAPLSVNVRNDLLFVTTESGVMISDLDGTLETGYIKRGKDPGAFDRPGAVAVAEDGTLYVADSLNYRVQAISPAGKPLWQYGKPLSANAAVMSNDDSRKFGLPSSITLDDNGYLYVIDGLNSEMVILTTDGEHVETIGDVGHDDGMFYYPDGIEYASGRLVIADKFNDRIEVFTVPTASGVGFAQYLPYGLALLLIPLILIPLFLLLRRTTYVMAPDFLSTMTADTENGAAVAKAIKKVAVIPALASTGAAMDLPLTWRSREPNLERSAELSESYALSEPDSQSLAIAERVRGKRILLTGVRPLRDAATDLEISALTYEEIMNVLVPEAASAPVTAPQEAGEEA